MSKLPPGPRINVLQTALYARDPYRYLIETQRKYGDPFTVPTLNGTLVITGVRPRSSRSSAPTPTPSCPSAPPQSDHS